MVYSNVYKKKDHQAALYLHHSWSVWDRSAEPRGFVHGAPLSALFPSPPSKWASPNRTESTKTHTHKSYTAIESFWKNRCIASNIDRVCWRWSYSTDLTEMLLLELLSFQSFFLLLFSRSSPPFWTYRFQTQAEKKNRWTKACVWKVTKTRPCRIPCFKHSWLVRPHSMFHSHFKRRQKENRYGRLVWAPSREKYTQ